MIGAPRTDMDYFTAHIDATKTMLISAHGEHVRIHMPTDKSTTPAKVDKPADASGVAGLSAVAASMTAATAGVAPLPDESYGPVGLKQFTDALALAVFDHLGDVTPMLPVNGYGQCCRGW